MRPAEPRTRVNETIRVPQVRLIDDDGSQIGVKARDEALEYAWAKNLDLVEVAPDANPPVCRVMDYGKYRYDQEQKQKLARKHQSTITIKEIKLRPEDRSRTTTPPRRAMSYASCASATRSRSRSCSAGAR